MSDPEIAGAARRPGPECPGAAMSRAQGGDREAYAAVLRWLAERAARVCSTAGLGATDAGEAVRDCLALAHRVRHTFDPERPLDAWADAIIGHVVDARGRNRRRLQPRLRALGHQAC